MANHVSDAALEALDAYVAESLTEAIAEAVPLGGIAWDDADG